MTKQDFQDLYGNLGIVSFIKPEISQDKLTGKVSIELGTISDLANAVISPQILSDGYISGELKSANFKTGETGWLLTPTSAEFNVGLSADSLDIPDTTTADSCHIDTTGNLWLGSTSLATGKIQLLKDGTAVIGDYDSSYGMKWDQTTGTLGIKGNLVSTKTFVLATYNVEVDVGESIQDAIDAVYAAGGGEVILKDGTHTPSADINLYSEVYLKGQTALGTVIDFGSQAYAVKATGTDVYNTGDATIVNATTSVEGSGTTWTSAMIGRKIFLGGIWYVIYSVDGNTDLTIVAPYVGDDLVNDSYVIANPINDVRLDNITITGSITTAVQFKYVDFGYMENVVASLSVAGVEMNYVYRMSLDIVDALYNYTNISLRNTSYSDFNSCGVIGAQAGNGLEMMNCSSMALNDSFILDNVGDGINIVGCSEVLFKGITSKNNGEQGIEFVSDNDGVELLGCALKNNTSDGVRLTASSDNGIITNCFMTGNGGYGLNIAAGTCDNNYIGTNHFFNNTTGELTDSGTDTKYFSTFFPGTILSSYADTEENTVGAFAYVKVKQITVNQGGILRTKFDIGATGAGTTCYGRIYKNGVALGTEQSQAGDAGWATFTEDLTFEAGDSVELWWKGVGAANPFFLRNFRIYTIGVPSFTVDLD